MASGEARACMAHQWANVVVSSSVMIAWACDGMEAAVAGVFAWLPIDAVMLTALARGSASRRQSVLVHHAIAALACVLFFADPTYALRGPIGRSLLALELTTPAVCLHNVGVISGKVRNVVWLAVRVPACAALVRYSWDAADVSIGRGVIGSHVVCLGLVALSVAWTLRAQASTIAFLGPCFVATRRGDLRGMLLTGAVAATTTVFYSPRAWRYRAEIEFLDKMAIAVFVVCATFGVSTPATVTIGGMLCLCRKKARLDASVHALVLCSSVALIWRLPPASVEQGMCMASLVTMVAYLCITPGPRALTFGHRIAWHACAGCQMSAALLSG